MIDNKGLDKLYNGIEKITINIEYQPINNALTNGRTDI